MALREVARFQVARDGGLLTYYRYGPEKNEGGKTLLAIHGITASSKAWLCFVNTLVTRNGFTIYAVDLRGRADSNNISGPFGMRAHAEDMLALLDHAGLSEPVNVCGHSMGGFVVAGLASIAPERILRATLIDGGVPFPMPAGHTVESFLPLVLGPALKRLSMTFPAVEDYVEYFRTQKAFQKAGWSKELTEYVTYDLHGDSPSTNPLCVEADSRALFGEGIDLVNDGLLRGLKPGTTLIRAERGLQDDAPLYPDLAVFSAYPNIHVVTLEDTNHYDVVMSQAGADRCIRTMFRLEC